MAIRTEYRLTYYFPRMLTADEWDDIMMICTHSETFTTYHDQELNARFGNKRDAQRAEAAIEQWKLEHADDLLRF